jgi:hypothetical protein
MTEKKAVYAAIAAVTEKLSKEGISKDRKNEQQGYKFRGIDDVYNALAPFLADAKLCILPNVQSRDVVERTSAKGNVLFYVTVKVDFAFVSADDGSEHHVITYGEAMDSGDKATNKAMSAAYKYACMQAFCIPTEGDNDADSKTHEVVAASKVTPNAGAGDDLTNKEKQRCADIAVAVKDYLSEGKDWDAYQEIEVANLGMGEKLYIWSLFDSKERAALKRMQKAERDKETRKDQAAEVVA